MKCPYCGKDVVEGSKFCDGCGAKLEENTSKEENVVYYQPKKSKAGLIAAIIIICLLVITGIVVTVLVLNNKGSKNNSSNNNFESRYKESDPKKDTKKPSNNDGSIDSVKYDDMVLENGDILVFVENKNKSEISFTLNIEYYDEEGTKVGSNSDSIIGLSGGEKTVVRFYHSDRKYKEYELSTEKMNSTYFESHKEDVSITSKDDKEEEEVVVTLKNNSKNKLDCAKVAVVYYKNGKVVGYSSDSEYDIDANKAVALYVYHPYDSNYNDIEFDKYEVYLVEAYSYKF